MLSHIKVPSKDVQLLSKACVDEVHAANGLMSDASGLRRAATISAKHACRDTHRLFSYFGLAAKLPISWYRSKFTDLTVPYFKVSDIIRLLSDKYPWLLSGGRTGAAAHELNVNFWDNFKLAHGDHAVFEHFSRDDLARVWPCLSHADGARTLKKTPIEVMSTQTAYGIKRKRNLLALFTYYLNLSSAFGNS